jgi:uncharacterized protein YlxW (UPF0749 family)
MTSQEDPVTSPATSAARLSTWAPLRVLTDLAVTVADTWRLARESRSILARLENLMSQFTDALADLDAQVDDLVAYVNSDDTTDAAEVEARAQRIKDALASARSGAVTPEPTPSPEPPAEPTPGSGTV